MFLAQIHSDSIRVHCILGTVPIGMVRKPVLAVLLGANALVLVKGAVTSHYLRACWSGFCLSQPIWSSLKES